MPAATSRVVIYARIVSVCGDLMGDMEELRVEHYNGACDNPDAYERTGTVRDHCVSASRCYSRVRWHCNEACRGGASEVIVLDQMCDDINSVYSALDSLEVLVRFSSNVGMLNTQMEQIRSRTDKVADDIIMARSSVV